MNHKHVLRGITRAEIVVIFAIVGLLAYILFPVFAAARNKARQGMTSSISSERNH